MLLSVSFCALLVNPFLPVAVAKYEPFLCDLYIRYRHMREKNSTKLFVINRLEKILKA